MAITVEAMLHPDGRIQLLEEFRVTEPTRVLVTAVPKQSLAQMYLEELASTSPEESARLREQTRADYEAGRYLTTAELMDYLGGLRKRGPGQ
jgi:hypothetical protein